MSRAVMQQALEAMNYSGMDVGKFNRINAACAALRQALAEPEQEPVACIGTNGELMWLNKPKIIYSKPIPLYTAPTPRKPLTYDELEPLCEAFDSYDTTQNELVDFARAIERAHGITGEQT